MPTNRGIAPLIILAIIALLAVGAGSAVYVSKTRNATTTPAVSVTTTDEAETSATSNTQVTTTPAKSTAVAPAVKTSSNVENKANTQPAVTATTKVATKTSVSAPVGSPRYYMQSGKDWECRIDNDKGIATWSYSHLYPNRLAIHSRGYIGEGYGDNGWMEWNEIFDFSQAIDYQWGSGFNNQSVTSLYNKCQLHDDNPGFRALDELACTFVQKEQDPKLFEVPTDRTFRVAPDYRPYGCSIPG